MFIPAVAVSCPVVRQGMLTLAAVCMHIDSTDAFLGSNPSKSQISEFLEVAETHGKVFVKECRQKLAQYEKGKSGSQNQDDAILACSRLLCDLGLAFFRIHRCNGVTLFDSAAWTWLHLLRGIKTSYAAVFGSGRPVNEAIINDMMPKLRLEKLISRKCLGCNHPCFEYVRQSRTERFNLLRSTLDGTWRSLTTDREAEDLKVAIDMLSEVTERVFSPLVPSLIRIICTWIGDIPKGFVDVLQVGFPPALAVYAHWLMLIILVEDLWWVHDMGRAGIRDVIRLCSKADPDTHALLTWAQHLIAMK